MELVIKMSAADYRRTQYFLRRRYGSKAQLPRLARIAIVREAAAQALKELQDEASA
jgi:hypothetical protein